ncbi:MAG: hypothetical protein AABM64_17885 [Pseudomonadota bacterium]
MEQTRSAMHPDWLNQHSGVEVHASRKWQKLGFVQKKTNSTGSEAICRNGLYAPTAADALCAAAHRAEDINFSGISILIQAIKLDTSCHA